MSTPHRSLLPVCLLFLLWGSPAAGQQGSLRLTEVLPGGALLGCPEIAAEVGGSGVEVSQGELWQPFTPPAPVHPDDRVAVPVPLDARMRIDMGGSAGGDVFLVPSLVCYPSLDADTVVFGIRPDSSHAQYQLFTHLAQENGRHTSRLGISAETGSLLVVGYRGPPFFVRAAGDTATIRGTTIAVLMAPSGDEGLFYLENGSATLSRLPGGVVEPGQLVHLRREAGPVLVASDIAESLLPALRNGLQHHLQLPWQPTEPPAVARARRLPWRWIVGGVLSVGALTYAVWPRDGGDDGTPPRRTGTVVIHIP